ncbi:MAG: DNA polymerase I [Thermodesulfobacteriota bacterium]|nr:DNA polymerase I [Thermodesulfobacteriota bacterium]
MARDKTLYLIDGTAYIHRGYHAVRSLSNSKGFPTNAIFSFTRMMIKFMKEQSPEYAVVLFDAKGPTFRHEIDESYKANRSAMPEDMAMQIPCIKQVVEAFNLAMFEKQGYEADDLIGTLAHEAVNAGYSVVIVSGDKDFAQLVSDQIIIWDPMKEIRLDETAVKERFKLAPGQIIDAMALAGDSADNIKGVPGIGEKTAISLIQQFGTLDALYDQVDTITKKKQHENLVTYKDQAYLSKKLVTIATDVPLSYDVAAFEVPQPDSEALYALFSELEFFALQKEFAAKTDLSDKTYTPVFSMDEVETLARRLETADVFAFDTETTSIDPMQAKLVGLSFSLTENEAFYIPVGHTYEDAPEQPDVHKVLDCLKAAFASKTSLKVAQNIKYDWHVLSRYGISIGGPIFDTMVAAYLLNPTQRGYGLDRIASDYLGHTMITYGEVAGTGKSQVCFSQVSIDDAVPYACEDADIAFCIYHLLEPKMKSAGLADLFADIEMPLLPVLMKMETWGIKVDKDALQSLSKMFEAQLEQLEKEIYAMAGEEFNINSPQQLGRILFEKLGLPTQKKTKKKTGYSTDADVLAALSEKHELPALILRSRTLSKLKSTYADALFDLINPETGRIHTSFNQTATATGRLSSTDPNLQNIPIRTEEGREIRRAFIPEDGMMFISADYSQVELRLLAHYSSDSILIEAFENDEDIHSRTAAEVFQVFPEMITDDVRRQAKAINFGIAYGMSPYGLSKELGISQKMAKNYIDGFFARYSGVKQFIDKTIATARETKMTKTLLGRIRHLPDIDSKNANMRNFAERTAINTPIQGTAADIIKLAMIQMDKALAEKGLSARMLLSVHDEMVFECPGAEVNDTAELVRTIMETVYPLKVPLKVNVQQGASWADAH